MTDGQLSPRTLRRLARSPYAPIPQRRGDDAVAPLRTAALAQLLLARLLALGPITEPAATMMLEARAPGRGREVIEYAIEAEMLRRVPAADGQPATLLAASMAPRPVAA